MYKVVQIKVQARWKATGASLVTHNSHYWLFFCAYFWLIIAEFLCIMRKVWWWHVQDSTNEGSNWLESLQIWVSLVTQCRGEVANTHRIVFVWFGWGCFLVSAKLGQAANRHHTFLSVPCTLCKSLHVDHVLCTSCALVWHVSEYHQIFLASVMHSFLGEIREM
jgi:hypothetical protein